jgi:hypothetical protein
MPPPTTPERRPRRTRLPLRAVVPPVPDAPLTLIEQLQAERDALWAVVAEGGTLAPEQQARLRQVNTQLASAWADKRRHEARRALTTPVEPPAQGGPHD